MHRHASTRRRLSAGFRVPHSAFRIGLRGFTLAELLIVMAIITIAATLILPVVWNLARVQRVGSAARSVQSMLHGARSMAIACRSAYGLMFYKDVDVGAEAANIRYACVITTFVPADGTDTPAPRQEEVILPTGLRVRLYQAGSLTPIWPNASPNPGVIRFAPNGTVRDWGDGAGGSAPLACPVRIEMVNAADESDSTNILIFRTGLAESPEPD